jgi:two-component system, sensor histidine kinase and response regulator
MSRRQVNLAELRERASRAIEKARASLPDTPGGAADNDRQHLVEELRVYQTELEIQNQELVDAQSEISLNLEKYRSLFAYLPLPAVVVDAQGFIIDANEQATRFLRLSQNAALQRRSATLLFDASSRSAIHNLLRDRSNESAQILPLQSLRVGDEITVCDVHVIHLHEESTPEGRTVLLFVDQSAEMALRESEHNLRSLADSNMGLIWAAGDDKQCYYFNRGWLEFTGRTLEEERGNGWMAGVHVDDIERCIAVYKEHFDQRQDFSMDYRLRRHDGEYRWIRDNGTPRFDSEGRFIGYIGHCLDITDRVEAEESLRKLSQAVEQSLESIIIADRSATIEYVNAACLRSTGYSEAELIGQNPRIFNSGATAPEVYASLWETLCQGKPWVGEFTNRRKNGEIYFEHVRITPIRNADGEVTNYVAVKEDITEKIRIAKELDAYREHLEEMVANRTIELALARDAAETANIAKSAFLANMSHEIRTPMNGVMMLTHLLMKTPVSPSQQDKLSKILGCAEHLLGVINNILDLSKIEAGKMVLEQGSFRLREITGRAITMIQTKAAEKGLKLRLAIDPQLPGEVSGDATRVSQALLNYLSNALKFTERGEIVLQVDQLSAEGNDLKVRFSVIDTGVGIDAETLKRLFQNFEQADNSTTRKFGGSGLGLAINKHLAKMMGGEVGAESNPQGGSNFWFTAIFRRSLDSAVTSHSAGFTVCADVSRDELLARNFRGTRILVCEDNPINQEIVSELLTSVGLVVDVAENGAVAIGLAANNDYRLILMDMQMPVVDGLEATRQLRQMLDYVDTPIVAMTANAFAADREACLEAGMDNFISKPFKPDDLIDLVYELLDRQRKISNQEQPR